MSFMSQLALVKEMIESCESSLRSAKQLLNELAGNQSSRTNYGKVAESLPDLNETGDERSKVVEGVFDGQNMVGKDKNMYPVPANYASKSKLIPGDVMKLTINETGAFIYKQIGPVERKNILGTLTFDNSKYKVLAGGKAYNVLTASVTYYKGEPGDQVSLIVPVSEESDWGAVDAIIPQNKVRSDRMNDMMMQDAGLIFIEDEDGENDETEEVKPKKTTTKKKSKSKSDDGIEDLDI